MGAHHRGQVHVREHVAVEDHGRVVEVALRVLDCAARPQRRRLDRIVDAPSERGAVTEHGLDALGLISHREHDLGDADAGEEVELMAQERAVHHRDHGLGDAEGEGAEAGAFSAGQDHCLHRFRARRATRDADHSIAVDSESRDRL
jgi:hypothetical protein